MRRIPTLALVALVAFAQTGCKKSPATPSEPAGQPPAGGDQGAAAPSGTTGSAAPAPKGPTAYVNTVAVLRREPTDAAKIPGKPGAKPVSNYLATLHRGEKVGVLETREDWARIRSSDDTEGWLKRSALLEQDGVTEATVLAAADVFDRPDLLAANAKRKIEPGTLVLVVKARPPFSQVNVSGTQDAWVLTDRLETSEKEVSVSKLIEKARYLVRTEKKDDALQLLTLAQQHFEGAALVKVMATELGVAPAGDAAQPAAAPAAGTTPAPAATDAGTAPAPGDAGTQ